MLNNETHNNLVDAYNKHGDAVISTIKKHGLNVYESIKAMLQQPSLIPWELAGE